MSSDLPENSSEWPSDPFRLLGINRLADLRTARRAYFKRIKQYKPDKCPAEFQLIHQAYELVKQRLDLNQFVNLGRPESSLEQTTSGSRVESNQTEFFSHASSAENPFDSFLRHLQAGKIADAFAIVNRMGSTSSPRLRARTNFTKYLLSRFNPKSSGRSNTVDSAKRSQAEEENFASKRMTWLLKALDEQDFVYPVLKQLAEEFDTNPKLALQQVFQNHLSSIKGGEATEMLMRLRWSAVGIADPDIVVHDMRAIQSNCLELGAGWERLLADSLEFTLWGDSFECKQFVEESWQEISKSPNSPYADSLEILMLAVEQWRSLRQEEKWMECFPWARKALPRTLIEKFLPLAEWIIESGTVASPKLELFFQNYPLIMAIFQQGLESAADSQRHSGSPSDEITAPHMTWDALRETVACFFNGFRNSSYASCRWEVLHFCIDNHLHPIMFAQVANSFINTSEIGVDWVTVINKDGPLLCCFSAYQLART